MNESFVAIGRGSLYPESRGKFMPEVPVGPEEESRKAPRADGPSRHGRSEADEMRAKEKAEAQKRAKKETIERAQREQEDRARREEQARTEVQVAKPQKPPKEVSFEDAHEAAKLITKIQSEEQVRVTPEEFRHLRTILLNRGYKLKEVERMSEAQIVVLAQETLREVKENNLIAQPEEGYFKSLTEESLARTLIEKATGVDEEILTKEKVEQLMSVEADKGVKGGRAVGAAMEGTFEDIAGEPLVEEVPKGSGEGRRFVVESSEPLEKLSREELVAGGVPDNVAPADWDKWNPAKRHLWLRKNVDQRTTFAEEEEIYRERGIQVLKQPDGSIQIITNKNFTGDVFSREKLNELLAKVDKNVSKYPGNWEKMGPEEKLRWIKKETGVEVLMNMGGGGNFWASNDVSVEVAFNRLKRLRDIEDSDPRGFATRGGAVDRRELIGNLRARRDALVIDTERIDLNEVIENLISLDEIEASITPPTFASEGFQEYREQLEEILRQYYRPSRVIADLLSGPSARKRELLMRQLDHFKDQRDRADTTYENFRVVDELNSAIKDQVARLELEGRLGDLDLVGLNLAERRETERIFNKVDEHFKTIMDMVKRNPVELTAFRDLLALVNQKADDLSKSYPAFTTIEQVRQALFNVVSQNRSRERREWSGILEWRAVNLVENMIRKAQVEASLGPPIDWKDSMRAVEANLRYFESGELAGEDIGQMTRRLYAIAEAIQAQNLTGRDKDIAEEMVAKINEIKDSVQSLTTLRAVMEGTAMNPEKVGELFTNFTWKDYTFKVYFRRFYEDHEQRKFVDGQGNQFNLLDKAMGVFFKQMREEKEKMNMIEVLTLVDFSREIREDDASYREILRALGRERLTDREKRILEEVRREFARRMAGRDQKVIDMRGVVDEWYRTEFLLGAHGYTPKMIKGEDGIERPSTDPLEKELYLDVWKRRLGESLKKQLEDIGVDPALIVDYERVNLLKQVVNNAHNLAFIMGAFSDYDGIRIWDREKEWFVDDTGYTRKRLGRFVYNHFSDAWTGRMVDHYGEFLLDENRGKPGGIVKGVDKVLDANYIYQKHMLGRKRGILGHNRLLVKLINDNLRNWEGGRDNLIVAEKRGGLYQGLDSLALGSFESLWNQKASVLDNARNKLDLGRLGVGSKGDYELQGGSGYDQGWVRGAAIEELLEDAVLSFENIKWSEIFDSENANISKFNMGDWWSDRTTTYKHFGAEALQKYLQTPSTELFYKLNSIEAFYSRREIRIHPWYKLVLGAHAELGKHWKEWWKLRHNLSSWEVESLIESAVEDNRLEAEYQEDMKEKLLGVSIGNFKIPGYFPLRRLNQYREFLMVVGRENLATPIWILFLFFWEFIKGAFGQSQAQLAGK